MSPSPFAEGRQLQRLQRSGRPEADELVVDVVVVVVLDVVVGSSSCRGRVRRPSGGRMRGPGRRRLGQLDHGRRDTGLSGRSTLRRRPRRRLCPGRGGRDCVEWALTEAISLSSAAIDWSACALIWPCSTAMYDTTTAFALAAANSAVGMVTKTWVVLLVPGHGSGLRLDGKPGVNLIAGNVGTTGLFPRSRWRRPRRTRPETPGRQPAG